MATETGFIAPRFSCITGRQTWCHCVVSLVTLLILSSAAPASAQIILDPLGTVQVNPSYLGQPLSAAGAARRAIYQVSLFDSAGVAVSSVFIRSSRDSATRLTGPHPPVKVLPAHVASDPGPTHVGAIVRVGRRTVSRPAAASPW